MAPEVAAAVDLRGAAVDVGDEVEVRERAPGRVAGALRAKPRAPSRKGAGKVDVEGAAAQRWDSAVTDRAEVPLLTVDAPKGTVTLRALSWIDAIRRQCGLPEGFEKETRAAG